jgi:hypothetical protein
LQFLPDLPVHQHLWSHYPWVCGPWFGSCPPHRVRLDDIAAFLRVRRLTRHRRSLGVSPSADLSAMRESYSLRADSHQHLRACGPRTPPLPRRAEGLSYFRSPVEHVFAFCCFQDSAPCGAPCDDVRVRWLSLPFEQRNATHHLSFTCRLLDRFSRLRPHPVKDASATSQSAALPSPTRLGQLPPPFAITVRSLVGREAGTTRSLRRLVFPFGHLSRRSFHDALFHSHDHHGLQ